MSILLKIKAPGRCTEIKTWSDHIGDCEISIDGVEDWSDNCEGILELKCVNCNKADYASFRVKGFRLYCDDTGEFCFDPEIQREVDPNRDGSVCGFCEEIADIQKAHRGKPCSEKSCLGCFYAETFYWSDFFGAWIDVSEITGAQIVSKGRWRLPSGTVVETRAVGLAAYRL